MHSCRAPGAALQDFLVTGCDGGAAVVLKRAAPGPGMTGGAVYPIAHPVRVRRVTFADSRTTALQMEAGTGATITRCSFLRNGDYRGELDISYPALLGYEGTNLAINSSYFAGNRNTSLHFQGELLEVKGCRFEHNLHSAIEVDFLQPPGEGLGGRCRGACAEGGAVLRLRSNGAAASSMVDA
jgi:hypothetical protein